MRKLRVLVGCESSGVVRNAFRALGHDAWSCDLLPADDADPYHLQGDVMDAIEEFSWDMGIFFPTCTYLCVSGLHWNKNDPDRQRETEKALLFVDGLLHAPIPMIALENPVGCISTRIRKPDQIIQPYQFGHDASKKTCLWLKGLPVLETTKYIAPRLVNGLPRWDNQTDSGQNRLGPSAERWKLRSKTYRGIAIAMAKQWGGRTR